MDLPGLYEACLFLVFAGGPVGVESLIGYRNQFDALKSDSLKDELQNNGVQLRVNA